MRLGLGVSCSDLGSSNMAMSLHVLSTVVPERQYACSSPKTMKLTVTQSQSVQLCCVTMSDLYVMLLVLLMKLLRTLHDAFYLICNLPSPEPPAKPRPSARTG